MPMLTDGQIKNVIKRVAKSQKVETLVDGEGRGTGRLVLVIKPHATRLTTVWYAQQWLDGKRKLRKVGVYPHMSLAMAQEAFTRDFSAAITKGKPIRSVVDTSPGTLADLFNGYVDALAQEGKASHIDVRKALNRIVDDIGGDRPARDVTPADIVNAIRPIFQRGKKSMADHMRSYIRSAYAWAMKSEHDYRTASACRFSITSNPADCIPTEEKTLGQRWLRENEWVQVWRWLHQEGMQRYPACSGVLLLLLLTGQRVQEVCRLHVDQYDRDEGMIDWSRTKNGRQHSIPLPRLAAELIDSLTPNEYGWYFPSGDDPALPVAHTALYAFVWRHRESGVFPHFTSRDLRRTFKTLAGKAGLSKDIRDRLQNHTMHDVSSQSYDRYNYISEKREAMAAWDNFVRGMIAGGTPPKLNIVKSDAA